MDYSRRQLEALGEPLGDSLTRLKPGGRIYGGGGSAAPTSTTTTQLTYPPEIKNLVIDATKKAAALSAANYQPYTYNRIAEFDPYQKTAQQLSYDMTTAPELAQGAQLAAQAGVNAGAFNYTPANIQTGATLAPTMQMYQMQAPERVYTGSFTQPGMAEAYMSPYMQEALIPQMREARRQSAISKMQNQATAVGQGAYGGSRQAIVEAERQRNLGTQLGDIQAQGLQRAYEQAQNLYGTEQSRAMQAALSNQQAGMTAGQTNLQALLGTQQAGAQNVMQAQLANQQALLEAQRLAEQSRQYGAGLGLQGIQQQIAAATQLGGLGQARFGQQKDIINAIAAAGQQRQALEQQKLAQNYQDFLTQKQYPYQQLAFIQEMVKSAPQQTTQQIYQAPPSLAAQLGGLGMAAYGASKLFPGGKEGGMVSSYAGGGLADLAVQHLSKG